MASSASSSSTSQVKISSLTKVLVLSDQVFFDHKTKVPQDVLRLKSSQIQYVKVSFSSFVATLRPRCPRSRPAHRGGCRVEGGWCFRFSTFFNFPYLGYYFSVVVGFT